MYDAQPSVYMSWALVHRFSLFSSYIYIYIHVVSVSLFLLLPPVALSRFEDLIELVLTKPCKYKTTKPEIQKYIVLLGLLLPSSPCCLANSLSSRLALRCEEILKV